MANYCDFNGRVLGKREQVEDFLKLWETEYDYSYKNAEAKNVKEKYVNYPDHKHFSRIFDFELCDENELKNELGDGKIEVAFGGYCAWSLGSCITMDGYYSWVDSEDGDRQFECIENWAKENPEVEVVICSVEPGCAFTERFTVKDGGVNEEVEDYYEFIIETEEDLESVRETLKISGINRTSIDLDEIEITDYTYLSLYASDAEWLDIYENDVLMNLD